MLNKYILRLIVSNIGSIVVLILLCSMCAKYSFAVSSTDVFTINNIKVQYDTGNVVDSKKAALDQATKKGLQLLLQKITLPKFHNKFNTIYSDYYPELVDQYILSNERMTSHSYSADVQVFFNSNAIRNLFIKHGIMFTDKAYSSCIIIPIAKSLGPILSRSLFNTASNQFALLKPALIDYDLEDITSIDLYTMMEASYKDFSSVMARYSATEVMLIYAAEENDKMIVDVKFMGMNFSHATTFFYDKRLDEELSELYTRMAIDVMSKMDSWWKGDKAIFNKMAG